MEEDFWLGLLLALAVTICAAVVIFALAGGF